MSGTLLGALRFSRRQNVCMSFRTLGSLKLNGLRNFSHVQGHYIHTSANPRKELRTLSALFTQYMQKTDIRTKGVNVCSVQNISTSSCRCTTEKGSERQTEEDDKMKEDSEKKQKGGPSDLKNAGIFAAIAAGFLAFSLIKYENLPLLDSSKELREVLLNNEVHRIIVSRHFYTGLVVNFMTGKELVSKRLEFRINSREAFAHDLMTVYQDLGIDPSEQLRPGYMDSRGNVAGMLLMGLLMLSTLRRSGRSNVRLHHRADIGKKNIPRKPQATMNEPNKEKVSMMDMLLGDRANARYIRGDILSKQGNGVTFKEVAGLKEAKYEVMEFVDYLKSSDNVKKLGGKHPRGVLLLGPPGCGKTLLAKAVATEAGVPFFALAGSQFVEMFGGLGASRMRNLFKEAREKAPCIIYVDEIDAIGKKRHGSEQASEEEHTLNQLLVELDGMGTTEGIIMIASTNRSDVLDKALLRPGRFDRQIQIDMPTVDEREEIFHVYMKKLKLMMDYKTLAPRLAQLTTGMSGADIANICNEAALHAARHANDSISVGDFYFAIERIVAGAEKKRSVITQEDRKVVAYHEAGHALVGWLLKHTDALLQVSIVPRTNNALGFAQLAPQDNYLYSDQQLFDRMCMMLGGRAAETITFNHVTTGAHDDLDKVTKQAYTQIRSWGMNDRVGCVSYDFSEGSPLLPYSKSLSNVMDEEVKKLVAKAYMATQTLLLENKATLDLLAKTLLEKESLTYDQVRDLIGPPPHGDKIKLEMVKILSEAKQSASESKPSEG